MKAASRPAAEVTTGRRIMLAMPPKRGMALPERGWFFMLKKLFRDQRRLPRSHSKPSINVVVKMISNVATAAMVGLMFSRMPVNI